MVLCPYFIYLDSKIVGTAKQIAVLFDDKIFQRENTTVLIKKYKHKSAKQIKQFFQSQNISYRFVLANDLDELQAGIIFYPFNAQSNCRAVANRRLKHIFITHGESNKIASVKPIIRIYDYVLTAGQAGIDRFLVNKVFTQYDVDNGRIVMAGDTFIGQTGLSSSGEPCLFYAPTWEGGIESENYSSLEYWKIIYKKLIQKANELKVNTIAIKSHPNMGYRNIHYQEFLFELAKKLKQNQLNVVIYQSNLTLSFLQKWFWRKEKIIFSGSLKHLHAIYAICDISAIETQLINENIPYELYFNPNKYMALNNMDRYKKQNDDGIDFLSIPDLVSYKNYVIDSKLSGLNSKDKIQALIHQIL